MLHAVAVRLNSHLSLGKLIIMIWRVVDLSTCPGILMFVCNLSKIKSDIVRFCNDSVLAPFLHCQEYDNKTSDCCCHSQYVSDG